jgi:HEPN domain-containing protein
MAGREKRARKDRNHDGICFHAQQCAEKLIKALLIKRGTVPPKSHDLVSLSQLLAGVLPDWSWPDEELRFLGHAAVAFRYPGESASAADALTAFKTCTRLRSVLLKSLRAMSGSNSVTGADRVGTQVGDGVGDKVGDGVGQALTPNEGTPDA